MSYAELEVLSNFSFLRGGSRAEELMAEARLLGLSALAVTDVNTLAGAVRLHVAANDTGMRFVVGCRLDLLEGISLLAWARDRAAYGRLCRLLTLGQLKAEKGECHLTLADVKAHPRDTRAWIEPQVRLLLEPWFTAARAKPKAARPTARAAATKRKPARRRKRAS